jgi:hypothetical protein
MRVIHNLAVGLMFGAAVFFTVGGVLMASAFEKAALEEPRPEWLPLPEVYKGEGPVGFPVPLRKEQGTRAFGTAVGSLFTFYFALQAGCAAAAFLTARALGGWLRLTLSSVVLALALAGWGVERVVHHYRGPRNDLTDEALRSPTRENVEKALAARGAFGTWHGVSLLLNFGTLALSGILVAVTALPPREGQ